MTLFLDYSENNLSPSVYEIYRGLQWLHLFGDASAELMIRVLVSSR